MLFETDRAYACTTESSEEYVRGFASATLRRDRTFSYICDAFRARDDWVILRNINSQGNVTPNHIKRLTRWSHAVQSDEFANPDHMCLKERHIFSVCYNGYIKVLSFKLI
jgi:hypothetical protein